MKVSQFLTYLVAAQTISAASLPEANHALITLEGHRVVPASEIVSPDHTLERRKGGGGRGGGGGGGRSSSGGSRGSGGSSAPARTSANSAAGGATRAGSGPPRGFGGGRYYGGGAATPYRAGGRTPKGLVAGALIAPLVMLSIMPGLWLYNTYPYHYNNQYRFYNETATNDTESDENNNNNNNDKRTLWARQSTGTGRNETLPVMCVCMEYNVCGCDENDDPAYLDELVGNGSYPALNKTLVTVSDVNGTKTLVLNGTLPNGTTAPGGEDDESLAVNLRVGKYAGYYAVGLMVLFGVLV